MHLCHYNYLKAWDAAVDYNDRTVRTRDDQARLPSPLPAPGKDGTGGEGGPAGVI